MTVQISADNDFAVSLLRVTNVIQHSFRNSNHFGRNWHGIDVDQVAQTHRAMYHRPHQPEY